MKIDYLVTSFDDGGAEFAIPSIVNLFTKMGHEVRIIACEAGNRIAEERLIKTNLPICIFSETRSSTIKHIWKYIKYIKKNDAPDIIFTSLTRASTVGFIVGKLLRLPVVSWKHSATLKRSTKIWKSFSKLWIADSLAVGEFVHNIMKIPSSNITIWPLFFCEISKTEREIWTTGKTLRIGSIGRLHKQKNYTALIDGIALFRNRYPQYSSKISVTILGDGPEINKLQNKITEHKLENCIELLGYSADIYNYLKEIDLYVQPSLYEGMCLAAHEALSTGLPLLATPVGEMKTSLEHDTGFTLHGDLSEAICSVLKKIFENPSILEQKSKNALNYMHHYYSKDSFEEHGRNVLKRMEAIISS